MFVNELFPILSASISNTAKIVFISYAGHANSDGMTWPATRRICELTGFRSSTVRHARSELVRAGLLESTGGCVFRVVLPSIADNHPEHPLEMVEHAPAPVVAKNATAAAPAQEPAPAPAPEPEPAPEQPTGDNQSPVAAPATKPAPVAAPAAAHAPPAPRREIVSASVASLPDVDDAVRRDVDARPIIRTSGTAQPDDDLIARARRLAARQAENAARHEMARLVDNHAANLNQAEAVRKGNGQNLNQDGEDAGLTVVVHKSPEPAPQHALPIICEPQTSAATPQQGELLPVPAKHKRIGKRAAVQGELLPDEGNSRGHCLPKTWVLPRSWGIWAMERFGFTADQVRYQADKFRDHWTSTTRNPTKKDWFGTWRNWMRKANERGERFDYNSRPDQQKSKMTQALDNLANMKLDWEHQETWNPFAPMTPEERAAAQKREEARAAARIAEAAKIINFKQA